MTRLTAKAIYSKKKKEKITVLTAYDYPTARILDQAEIDVILVGDSLGMVVLGYESTVGVTMREMLHHVKAVSRAVRRSLVVADMPFGSYETPAKALRSAVRFLKEGGADAVKLEGGRRIEKQIRALLGAGIPVMGHLGMTPQSASSLGGYKVQGRTPKAAAKILKDALFLDKAGVFSFVLECVPRALGRKISSRVRCPVIGIGAGEGTDGQVLVLHDMLGITSGVKPRFVRAYASLEKTIRRAAQDYRRDVLSGDYPRKEEIYE